MNQKSLDKKKTSEIFEGVNSPLHQSFIEAVEREKKPKELSACCSAEVATANSGLVGETNYYICTKCHNDCDVIAKPKELDRSFGEIQYGMNKINSKLLENSTLVKPKELEWEKEFDKKWEEFVNVGGKRPIKDFIQSLLTQQRTELLEEIKKMIDSLRLKEKLPEQGYELEGWERTKKYNLDLDRVEKEIKNLLNKKDDTK